jgi:hypothetical protein
MTSKTEGEGWALPMSRRNGWGRDWTSRWLGGKGWGGLETTPVASKMAGWAQPHTGRVEKRTGRARPLPVASRNGGLGSTPPPSRRKENREGPGPPRCVSKREGRAWSLPVSCLVEKRRGGVSPPRGVSKMVREGFDPPRCASFASKKGREGPALPVWYRKGRGWARAHPGRVELDEGGPEPTPVASKREGVGSSPPWSRGNGRGWG